MGRAGAVRATHTNDGRAGKIRHVTSEAGLALLDASHWASEQPWLRSAAEALTAVVDVEAVVSTLCTDPWTVRHP